LKCSSLLSTELKKELESKEKANQRLVEAFKKTSHEFREVCYQLLGYRLDFPSQNQYKLMSMYAESPEDFFLFKVSSQEDLEAT
jgi:mitotic spindle assembly checkpoint protein MAD1